MPKRDHEKILLLETHLLVLQSQAKYFTFMKFLVTFLHDLYITNTGKTYFSQGTVRVPAPVQYAHKLAQLVGQNLHRPPHNDLDDLLYFL
jgi:argonaute-like protein implicated in RNA metabolism and viral defense